MILNGVITLILLYFTKFDSLAAYYIIVIENIDLYCLQNIIFHFWPKLTHPAVRSLCDS